MAVHMILSLLKLVRNFVLYSTHVYSIKIGSVMHSNHQWLSEINAPVGSKEVIDHIHNRPLLIKLEFSGGLLTDYNGITSLNPMGALISVNPG